MKSENEKIAIILVMTIFVLVIMYVIISIKNVQLGFELAELQIQKNELQIENERLDKIGKIIKLTNESRLEIGVEPLSINKKLTEAAEKKAKHMFEFQYFDHNGPDGSTPWDFIKAEKYKYRYAGENLAIQFKDVESAHKALMKSPSHKDNILNENYKDIGVAIKKGNMNGKEVILIVYIFGK